MKISITTIIAALSVLVGFLGYLFQRKRAELTEIYQELSSIQTNLEEIRKNLNKLELEIVRKYAEKESLEHIAQELNTIKAIQEGLKTGIEYIKQTINELKERR